MAGDARRIELLANQMPSRWITVLDETGPYTGGLFCTVDVTLVLTDVNGNEEEFAFLANSFVPLNIAVVTSGATGNGVIGLNG